MKTEQWLSTVRRRSAGLAAALLAPTMMVAAPMGAVAQEQDIQVLTLRSYPLAIHEGTCETVVAEPSYDLGFLVPRALFVEGEEAAVDEAAYDTGVFDPFGFGAFYGDEADAFGEEEGALGEEGAVGEEEGVLEDEAQNELIGEDTEFLFDDVDGDGLYDYGLDLNRDGILDQAEIVERPIIWAYESDLDDIEAGIAEEEEDAEVDDLRATPHVLMVHGDTIIDTNYLACGEIQGAEDEDGQIAVALRPVTANGFVGIAVLEEGETGFLGIGGDSGEVEAWMIPSRVSQAVGQPPSVAGAPAPADDAQATATQPLDLMAAETGFDPATLTAPAGEVTLAIENPRDVERTFLIPDLGIEQTLAPGETTEVTFEATEPGTYPFMIEGEEELTGEVEITE